MRNYEIKLERNKWTKQVSQKNNKQKTNPVPNKKKKLHGSYFISNDHISLYFSWLFNVQGCLILKHYYYTTTIIIVIIIIIIRESLINKRKIFLKSPENYYVLIINMSLTLTPAFLRTGQSANFVTETR